jgi:hypothetical protein
MIQTSRSSFSEKRLDRLFCSTNEIVVAQPVLGVDPTLQYRRSKRIAVTKVNNSARCASFQVYSQIKALRPRYSISFCNGCLMLQLPIHHQFDIEFSRSLQHSNVRELSAFYICHRSSDKRNDLRPCGSRL